MPALYFECHITIEPVFGDDLERAKSIVGLYKFRMAKLLMQKGREDMPEVSKKDTFTTGHSNNRFDITKRMVDAVRALKQEGFEVKRYKIEKVEIDSKVDDVLGLLTEEI